MKPTNLRQILLKCTAVICLAALIVCIITSCSLTSSWILQSKEMHGSLIFQIANYQKDYCVLTPEKSFISPEEEHVLYAIQNDETDFLSTRELLLYQIIKCFQKQYSNQSDIEKVFAAVVTTCYLCKYDLQAEKRSTAYSALVGNRSVCAGYARAVQLLLCSVGVECLYIVNDNHAWNMVRIDGLWFHCDSTFCDRNQDSLNYNYVDNTRRSERIKATLDSLDYFLMDDYHAAMSRKEWNRRLYPEAVACPKKYLTYVIDNYYS